MKSVKQRDNRWTVWGALSLSAIAAFGVAVQAAPAKKAPSKGATTAKKAAPNTPRRGERRGERRERGRRTMDRLNLTEAQKQKIKPIMENSMKQRKALFDNKSLTPEQRRQKMRAIHEATQAKIRPILNATQRKQLETMEKERKQRRQNWEKGRKGSGQKGGGQKAR